jgi:hypothetical protein
MWSLLTLDVVEGPLYAVSMRRKMSLFGIKSTANPPGELTWKLR